MRMMTHASTTCQKAGFKTSLQTSACNLGNDFVLAVSFQAFHFHVELATASLQLIAIADIETCRLTRRSSVCTEKISRMEKRKNSLNDLTCLG
eukprot:scaffold3870_cov126-Skeletonema_marinoi.AAC.2